MVRRRFIAPARADVLASRFDHPVFADVQAARAFFERPAWPAIAELDAWLHRDDRLPDLRLAAQTPRLLADGLHYEERIAQGGIATRAENWHDLFNACIWDRHAAIKRALNARQLHEIPLAAPQRRTRAQDALTQFDEAGVIIRLRDAAVLTAWDAHDWPALFHDHAAAWDDGRIGVAAVIGHALLEHALCADKLLVGKALLVQGDVDAADAITVVARAILQGDVLRDPQDLRPLPLSGIPGWHAWQDAAFYREAACFQPLRAGRRYPPPLSP